MPILYRVDPPWHCTHPPYRPTLSGPRARWWVSRETWDKDVQFVKFKRQDISVENVMNSFVLVITKVTVMIMRTHAGTGCIQDFNLLKRGGIFFFLLHSKNLLTFYYKTHFFLLKISFVWCFLYIGDFFENIWVYFNRNLAYFKKVLF